LPVFPYFLAGFQLFVYLETSCAKYIFEKEIDLRERLCCSRFYTQIKNVDENNKQTSNIKTES